MDYAGHYGSPQVGGSRFSDEDNLPHTNKEAYVGESKKKVSR